MYGNPFESYWAKGLFEKDAQGCTFCTPKLVANLEWLLETATLVATHKNWRQIQSLQRRASSSLLQSYMTSVLLSRAWETLPEQLSLIAVALRPAQNCSIQLTSHSHFPGAIKVPISSHLGQRTSYKRQTFRETCCRFARVTKLTMYRKTKPETDKTKARQTCVSCLLQFARHGTTQVEVD